MSALEIQSWNLNGGSLTSESACLTQYHMASPIYVDSLCGLISLHKDMHCHITYPREYFDTFQSTKYSQ